MTLLKEIQFPVTVAWDGGRLPAVAILLPRRAAVAR